MFAEKNYFHFSRLKFNYLPKIDIYLFLIDKISNMKRKGQQQNLASPQLLSHYEAMLQSGELSYLNEEDWLALIDYYSLGVANKSQVALTVSERAIAQHPFSIELHVQHARMLNLNDESKKAIEFIEEKQYLSPNDKEMLLVKAQALLQDDEDEKSQALLAKIKKEADPELLIDILLTEADVLEKQQEFDLMFESLQNVLLLQNDNQEALERIWLCTELSGRYEDSIILHKKVLELDSFSFQAWYNLGQAYFSEEKYNDAQEAFEYAYLINDDFEFAYRDRGEALLILGKYKDALNCYQEVKEKFIPDSDLYCKIGQCYGFLDQPEIALEHFAVSLQMGNVDADVYFHTGLCLNASQKFESAIDSLEKAIKIDPEREEFHLAIADIYFHIEKNEPAIYHYQKAVDIAPENSIAWLHYASFNFLHYGEEAALEIIDEALFYCDTPEFQYFKVVCLIAAGRRQEGMVKLLQLLKEFPAKANFMYEVMPDLIQDTEFSLIIEGK